MSFKRDIAALCFLANTVNKSKETENTSFSKVFKLKF